ncbi:MAG TPA: Holliday junction resolvase RuvX [Spirochaetota bacterium]|nr:Holliday junction resolvase RuvX [Spirochaetota bacterium]
MKRLMSIDYGDARIGVALSDPMQIIASGYKTVLNDKNANEEVMKICVEKNVEALVVGIPFDQNSEIGEAAKKVLNFIRILKNFLEKNEISIPFYEQDERYTTMDALNSMKELKIKRNKKKLVVDQIAAANILSDFMRSKKRTILELPKISE